MTVEELTHALSAEFPHLFALHYANRPENTGNSQPIGNEIPAERLAHYGKLMLEMAEEERAREAAKAVEIPVNGQAES